MRFFDAATIRARLDWPRMIEAIAAALRADVHAPVRSSHTIEVPGQPSASLLLMPAWQVGNRIGVKLVTVFPGKQPRSVAAVYLLFDGLTGDPLAMFEGEELTARRTAGASALASSYLSRSEASHLVMVGAGRQSRGLIEAHMSVRPITRVTLWSRTAAHASAAAAALAEDGIPVVATTDLETAIRSADIVSCATLSTAPLVLGGWLRLGTHVDLVGAFRASMRETDDAVLQRAHLIVVDDRSAALAEGGDIVQALRSGAIGQEKIAGDLRDLVGGKIVRRTGSDEITVFKSVGFALEDLAAADAVYGDGSGVPATADETTARRVAGSTEAIDAGVGTQGIRQ